MIVLILTIIACAIKPQEGVYTLPEPTGIVKIDIDTFGENIPESKEDGSLDVMLKIKIGSKRLKTFGTIQVQGTSTAAWPKKNWTLKFYEDEARSIPLKVQIGNSVAVEKWVAKAEWVDPSMLRNGVSYRLWESMTLSREGELKYEVDNANQIHTHAQGFPKNYPAVVNVDKEHYGLSVLLMGHEPDNFNIDINNPQHIYMEFDARGGYTSTKTWDKFNQDGIGEWISGYYPKTDDFTQEMKDAIDELGNLINGSLENFKANFDQHLDKQNMIDMLLLLEVLYDTDAYAQDLEIVSYDLRKWYMLPWDKDTTFGMAWDGSGLIENTQNRLVINYEEELSTQRPWYKTYHAFTDEVEARYKELRDTDIFSVNHITELSNIYEKAFTKSLRKKEIAR